jgi:ribonuclease HI
MIKALSNHHITSKVVWDCCQSVMQLAKHNRAQTLWVSSHEGTDGNETADHVAKQGSEHLFKEPEPVCGIST